MGSYGYLSEIDISASRKFVDNLRRQNWMGQSRALDCGSGMGRVTQELLAGLFEKVDLLD